MTRLALVLLSTVFALGLAEIAARLLAPLDPPVRLAQFTDIVEQRHHIEFPTVFVYDPDRFWGLAPDTRLPDDAWPLFGRIANRQGVREEGEIARSKPRDETRVLFLGDSTTFGYGVPAGATYVEQTERILEQRFPGRRIECINGGVPGYTLFQGWRTLDTIGFEFAPDLVVVSFGWNELAEWDGVGDLAHHAEIAAATPPGFLRHSRLCLLVWRATHPVERPDVSGGRPRLVPYEFREVLETMADATARRGIDLVVLVWPSSENVEQEYRTPLQEEQIRFAERHRLGDGDQPAIVDGIAVMRRTAERLPRSELYLDPIHATAVAHRAIAEALAETIRPWLVERETR